MNDTEATAKSQATQPADPVMAAGDAAMFSPLTRKENQILRAHLASGWCKQSAVYPLLSQPWRETSVVLDDLHVAWDASWQAGHEPEAGQ